MKILHVLTGMQAASGVSAFVGGFSAALSDAGEDVFVAVQNPHAAGLYALDARVKLIPISSLSQVRSAHEFDIVHIHGLWPPILHKISQWANREHLPVVWSPHGMLAPWAMKHKWWKKWLPWHLYQKGDLKKAKMLHVTSEQEADWIKALGFTQPITVAPLGTHLPSMRPGAEKREKVLLFVGRIYPVKALDRLIQAFAMVPLEVCREWRLRLVGPDQAGHKECLDAIVKSMELERSVEFAGPKYGDELSAEYDACDCLALVSHTENFGATVVDAMAHGKPVITSDKTPWREVMERRCGWWVSNEPASLSAVLGQMMSLPDEDRQKMGERGRRLVEEKYTWDAVVKTMVKGYAEILSTGGEGE